MKFYTRSVLRTLLCIFAVGPSALAQNNNAPSSVEEHDIKITGYLQAQYQRAGSAGINSFSGGDFEKNSADRFMIRRGRLKIDRVDKFTNIVFQLDATQNGVQLMDAFIQVHPAGNSDVIFTAGLFNRPFGHSISYSSGYRDFPERARVFQTLMPRERDLGLMASFTPAVFARTLTASLAVVNGSGLSAKDYDSKKDLIGSLQLNFDSLGGNFHLGAGGSFYSGSVRSDNQTLFRSGNVFIAQTDPENVGKHLRRTYFGVNLQLQYDTPLGATTLKTEYVGGIQPGIAGSAGVNGPDASTSFGTQPSSSLYARHFNGYFLWLSHKIKNSGITALVAYDVYDPNRHIKGNSVGLPGNNTTSADVRYDTFGYGLTCEISKQVRFTLYNEHVRNETTILNGLTSDINDNVFTARVQYRW